jgi:peptidoglycan/xylan/chitin deacetylase (PgdA/CDA1 family)
VNEPRPWGSAGALAVIALAATVACLPALQASSIRSFSVRSQQVAAWAPNQLPIRAAQKLPAEIPAWEVVPPSARLPVVPVGRPVVKVPILMYHYVRPAPDRRSDPIGWGLSTPPEDFQQQMSYLDQNGYHPITLVELREYLAGVRTLPDKPVVLTFDDGYEDFYTTAYPVLRQHKFRAVAYVVSGFIGRGSNLSADQIRELDAYGIEIGAHTVDHVDLTHTNTASLVYEVLGSKSSLEVLLGHPVPDFCYPSGKFDGRVVAAVQAAGFQSATTTQTGSVHSFGDRYAWSRVRVFGSESLQVFADGLSQYEAGVPPISPTPIRIPRVYPFTFTNRHLAHGLG